MAKWYPLQQLKNLVKVSYTATQKLSKVSYTSTLDYCDIIYENVCKKKLPRVQRSQDFAAREITHKQKYDSISPTIGELGWLTMDKR